MNLHYLEIVTPDVETTCALYSRVHDITFSEPCPELGHARTAALVGGGMIGVRAPMHDAEAPVVRPYLPVDDLAAAVTAAEGLGAQIALPAMEIPGRGKIALYFLDGVQHGLWQV